MTTTMEVSETLERVDNIVNMLDRRPGRRGRTRRLLGQGVNARHDVTAGQVGRVLNDWRKLARWAADNVRIIKDLKPPQPPAFNNRLSANWKLMLQIAQHAGGSWPEQARRSAIYLSRAPYEPSVGVQLLAILRSMLTKNRTEITSEQV